MRGFRNHHDIAVFRDGEWAERGEITLEAAAKLIGVCNMTALDPARASDPQALPDLEIVYVESGGNEGKALEPGWYWRVCLMAGYSERAGPFETEAAALADAMQ